MAHFSIYTLNTGSCQRGAAGRSGSVGPGHPRVLGSSSDELVTPGCLHPRAARMDASTLLKGKKKRDALPVLVLLLVRGGAGLTSDLNLNPLWDHSGLPPVTTGVHLLTAPRSVSLRNPAAQQGAPCESSVRRPRSVPPTAACPHNPREEECGGRLGTWWPR